MAVPVIEGELKKLKSKPGLIGSPFNTRWFTVEARAVEGFKDLALVYYSSRSKAHHATSAKAWVFLKDVTWIDAVLDYSHCANLSRRGELMATGSVLKQLETYPELMFEVDSTSRHFFLKASTTMDRDRWVAGLRILCGFPDHFIEWPQKCGRPPKRHLDLKTSLPSRSPAAVRSPPTGGAGSSLTGTFDPDDVGWRRRTPSDGSSFSRKAVSNAAAEPLTYDDEDDEASIESIPDMPTSAPRQSARASLPSIEDLDARAPDTGHDSRRQAAELQNKIEAAIVKNKLSSPPARSGPGRAEAGRPAPTDAPPSSAYPDDSSDDGDDREPPPPATPPKATRPEPSVVTPDAAPEGGEGGRFSWLATACVDSDVDSPMATPTRELPPKSTPSTSAKKRPPPPKKAFDGSSARRTPLGPPSSPAPQGHSAAAMVRAKLQAGGRPAVGPPSGSRPAVGPPSGSRPAVGPPPNDPPSAVRRGSVGETNTGAGSPQPTGRPWGVPKRALEGKSSKEDEGEASDWDDEGDEAEAPTRMLPGPGLEPDAGFAEETWDDENDEDDAPPPRHHGRKTPEAPAAGVATDKNFVNDDWDDDDASPPSSPPRRAPSPEHDTTPEEVKAKLRAAAGTDVDPGFADDDWDDE